ncbi:uncharacterized protein LOC106131848 [Amyelois transitella]|uniref:uncharacterized protein LOC106131848 n=1 Tax=Amyelois transitella TaxID=680683 RepID=UPI00298F88FD|nr:uncharacterized protein LOC106131848 [Amyelois transitella]
METVNKSRTPSRCREWERQRRNKFNEAISKLGDLVKTIIKENDATGKDVENIQYPKIEIIQKAILCLANCVQEKTQLKTEILALQVKLDAHENKKRSTSDASTQVFCKGPNRKKQYSKKFIMTKKSKCNALKEKSVLTTNVTVNTNTSKLLIKESTQKVSKDKLPILLPNLSKNKSGPENTIVVLPAGPYIIPQRPLIFPALPPTIVLVDQNLQPINKTPIHMVNRSNGDITKTTMVNILPISAYSRPLSASKVKKSNLKSKIETTKKAVKKSKTDAKIGKSKAVKDENVTDKCNRSETKGIADNKDVTQNKKLPENNEEIEKISVLDVTNKVGIGPKNIVINKEETQKTVNDSKINVNRGENIDNCKEINTSKCSQDTISAPTTMMASSSLDDSSTVTQSIETTTKFDKSSSGKEPLGEDKDKENKLPTILHSTLCDTVVDAGNARLELAEEFLAASPTAAFLMSFPLVSGNRADSPAEEPHSTLHTHLKDSNPRRIETTQHNVSFYEKPNCDETKKEIDKPPVHPTILSKDNENSQDNIQTKEVRSKILPPSTVSNVSNDNPFLNLPMPSLISTNCTISDTSFGLDFDCNLNKSIPNPSTNYATSGNFFYKSDPFSTVKSTIYSTSSISSGHEFNSLGLYPCAMEKYTSKNKTEYSTVEDNLMKIGSSRLTYDIDLGWSHKGFDFVGCTTAANTIGKDNILTTVSSSYSNCYPFNSEFHIPLVSNSNKKENVSSSKPISSFADTITSFYSQPTSLWTDDVPFYTNTNIAKTAKHHNYLHLDHTQANATHKSNNKHYNAKITSEPGQGVSKTNGPQASDKYTKKSPSKMHINWMTSEIRPIQNIYVSNNPISKESQKLYGQTEVISKKQDPNESNFFSLPLGNFPTQNTLEELQVWPSARTVGPTEISIEPPPINLPTLVGDLALGPHDKKKHTDLLNRGVQTQTDAQNCGNFLSVTQLMNRSSDNMASRYQVPSVDPSKPIQNKQLSSHFTDESSLKSIHSRLESRTAQPCYVFNDQKGASSYDNIAQYPHNKSKSNKNDKSSKVHKNSYSAEALIRGGTCTQKVHDSSTIKFMSSSQKYNNFNTTQDNTIAQVSHFPPMLDYSDNTYTGQQFSGTTLYNTTNTISNSFYSNFMPGTSNLMSGNYTGGPFPGDFMDYNQTAECNYSNHKYEELKMRNNTTVFSQDKPQSSYKGSRRESAAKHKIECSKKESNKKYQSKRTKVNESEEWNDQSHILWQNRSSSKRHANPMTEELPFPNYVGNQMPGQYQPDFFNTHLMPTNVQSVGHNVDRSLPGFPVTSRANFNLSTIFPEITMKVQ